MSGALVGMRIDGCSKWMRLHGERRCADVLAAVLTLLRRFDDARLAAYARQLQPVDLTRQPFPTPAAAQCLLDFFEGRLHGSSTLPSWAEVFAHFPDLDGWMAGLPFMPAAPLQTCGDVDWGLLIELDTGELHIYDNRHIRLPWQNLEGAQAAQASLGLAHARQLQPGDGAVIEELLNQHAPTDGELHPALPVPDQLGAAHPGPAGWLIRLQLQHGRAALLLQRQSLQLRIAQAHGLRLDTAGLGDDLRKALPSRLLELTQAIYGSGASLAQLARVAAQQRLLPFDAAARGLPLLDLGLRRSHGLDWPLGDGFFDLARTRLLAAGMTVQAWRFLMRQDAAVLRFLLQYFPPSPRVLGDFARFVNLIASALQSEPLQLPRAHAALRGVERILDRTRGRPSPVREENARIFLRALMRARLSAQELANLAHDAQDVSDFVYVHPTVLKGATWRSLCRRSDAWHRALLITVDPSKDVRWLALLPRLDIGPYTAVELDSGHLLAEEGLEQRHCVGSYVPACSSGASRIFSLRRSGRRVATIELQRNHAGEWTLVQIRGKANAVVRDADVLAAGQAVAQAYARAAAEAGRTAADVAPSVFGSIHTAQPGYLIHRQEHWTG